MSISSQHWWLLSFFHVIRFCGLYGIPSTTALLQNCFSTCAVAVGTTPRSVSLSTAWNTSSFSSIPAKDEMHARSSAPASQTAWRVRQVTSRHAAISVVYRSHAFVTGQQICLQRREDAFVHALHLSISWFPCAIGPWSPFSSFLSLCLSHLPFPFFFHRHARLSSSMGRLFRPRKSANAAFATFPRGWCGDEMASVQSTPTTRDSDRV